MLTSDVPDINVGKMEVKEMRTYVKYEHDDYDEQETTVTGMTMMEKKL